MVANNPNIDISSLNEDEVIQPMSVSETTSKSFAEVDSKKPLPDSHQKNKLYFDVLKDNREAIRVRVRERLDEYLNRYDTGLVLKQVVLDRTQAPDEVRDAFDDVSRAKEDEDRFKKEAEAYRNAVIPQARGEAKRLEEEAEAYRNRLIDSAEGDAERFTDLLTEYRKAPDVTRERLYLETMTGVYSATSKVLVDVEKGNSLIYLPLEQLVKGRNAKTQVLEQSGASQSTGSSAGADDGGSGREASRSLYSTPNRELR